VNRLPISQEREGISEKRGAVVRGRLWTEGLVGLGLKTEGK